MSLRLRANPAGTLHIAQIDLALPAIDEDFVRAKRRLGIEEFAEAEIISVDYVFPYFATMVPQDCITVEDANELALCIEQMNQNDGEILKYLSAVEVEKPNTFRAALRLAMELDDYECIPDNGEEYGRKVLERIGADEEVLAEIDGYMDYASLGRAWMQEDGALQTEFGMIRRLSEPFDNHAAGEMRME